MDELFIDIETRSRQDLRSVGVYRYVEDPDFKILMAGWALNDEPVQVAFGEDILDIPGLFDPDVLKVAHNAQFERVCFSEALRRSDTPTIGTGYLPPEEWHDTMAVAAERGYPKSLEMLAHRLGGEQKDSAGSALIRWFCVPDRKGNFRRPEDHPEKWAQFVEYCVQDVETHRDAHRKMGGFPTETERLVYIADQKINDIGLPIDMPMAVAAAEAAQDNQMMHELEVMSLTGVRNPGSREQMLEWFDGTGVVVKDLRAETVEKILKQEDLDPTVRRVLELRQELAGTATKKYPAAIASACKDGRIRGAFRFFGAHTGRWAGKGVQPQNMPRDSFLKIDPRTGKKVHDESRETAAILDLKMGNGASASDLKKLVRALFIGPFTVVDYAAIEARVIAWLAGEEWALEAFRSGRDIYVETAERMSTPTKPLTRFQGKVAVLALGYNGGVNSLRAMGAEGTDAELDLLVRQWRRANPSIVQFWREMGDAFFRGGMVGKRIEIVKDEKDRYMVLPSGRAITYRGCSFKMEETQYGPRRTASFLDPDRGGHRVRTYGGRLSENATQAVARDLLAEALVRLLDKGYRVVGHVHDEIIVEGSPPVDEITRIMTENPPWADGLPIGGEGFTCRRYRKG